MDDMKSTTRILGGFKAHRTRLLNNLRDRVWHKLREISIAESGWVPTILPLAEGGYELSFNMGYGLREIKMKSKDEARDYVVFLFCCSTKGRNC